MTKSFNTPPPDYSNNIPIIHILYEAYKLWHFLVIKFPKSEKYTLGQVCGNKMLILLENILSASSIKNQKIKLKHLRKASVDLDLIKLLIRLAKDCDCLSNKSYLGIQSKLHQAGKMLGGWIKSLS